MQFQSNQFKKSAKYFSLFLFSLFIQSTLFADDFITNITGKAVVCEGETVSYSVPYTSGSDYTWSAVGGVGLANIDNVNNLATFTVTWGGAGSPPNSVSVQEFNNGVLVTTKSLSITIYGTPEPQITSDFNSKCGQDSLQGPAGRKTEEPCQTVCEYTDVTYTVDANSGSQYEWSVLGANVSISGANSNSATVSWEEPGQAYVIVEETNAGGCKASDTICIKIVDRPTARFSVDHGGLTTFSTPSSANANFIEICKGGTVCFDDLSTGGNSWHWDFGNGSTSSQENPCETFDQDGLYLITQIVENECHCKDTSYFRVKVSQEEGPEIVCQNVVCGNGTFSYDAILPEPCNGGEYEWNISNNGSIVGSNGVVNNQTPQSITGINITTIDVDWGSGPNGKISLSIKGCSGLCDKTTTVNIPIIPNTIDIEGDSLICAGEPKKYKVPCFPGTTYRWTVDGQVQNETGNELLHQSYMYGNHTISVSYKNDFLSCSGQSTDFNFRVLQSFDVWGSSTVCEGDTAFFNGPYNAMLNWAVKDENGNTVDTSNGAMNNFETITTLPPGSYTVVATDENNPRAYCNDRVLKTLEVLASPPTPTMINGPTEICVGEAAVYTSHSTSSDYLLAWEIDNNGSITRSNGNSVSVSWASGNKSITLYQVSKLKNCRSAGYTLTINEKTPPNVSITGPDTVCGNTSTSSPINYQTTAALDGYSWSINPATAGSVIAGQNTNSIDVIWNDYNGLADVVLTPVVCTDSFPEISYPVVVTTPSMSISGPDTICQASAGTWIANFDFGNGSNYSWEIEDVSTSTIVSTGNGNSANYNFPNESGSFIVRMSATNCMLSYTEVKNIVVDPAPVANLSYSGDLDCIDNNTATLTLSMQGASTYTYQWYYNGSPMSPQPSGTTHTIGNTAADAGNYAVNVTDANGCSALTNILTARICDTADTCTQIISSAAFTYSVSQSSPTPGCNQVSFTSTVSPSPNSITWFHAGSVIATGSNPTYTFPSSGIYPVKMIASFGKDTCTAIDTKTVVVPVVSDFEVNISCIGNDFEFNLINTSDVVINPLNSFTHQWKIYDINNNNTLVASSSSQDFLNVQNLVGGRDYEITLNESKTISWAGQNISANCTHKDTIRMPSKAAADFIMSDLILCEGNTLSFTDQSNGDIAAWNWDFGDGSSILTQNPGKTYQDTSGIFDVELFVKDEYGCVDSTLKQVEVKPNNIDGNITSNVNGSICPGDSAILSFNNTTSPTAAPYSYLWSNNSSGISTTVHQTSTQYIAVTDDYGCYQKFGPKTVEVINMPKPEINGKTNYCAGEFIELTAFYGSNYVYEWYQNNPYQNDFYITGPNKPSLKTFASAGEYKYFLVLSDTANNCTDTSEVLIVTVNNPPAKPSLASNPTPACPDSPVTLLVTNPQDYESIVWSTGQHANSITTSISGLYYATVTDTNGCSNQEAIRVHEMPDFCGFMCGCYSDCIEEGDTFRFPGIEGNYSAWRWEKYDDIQDQWVSVSSGTGTVDDYIVTNESSETIRLYVETIDGCSDYSCETDLDISFCIPECDGRAFMKQIDCVGESCDSARYDFRLGMSFTNFGKKCDKYEVSIVPPLGTITTNPSPIVLSAGTHELNGTWDLDLQNFAGGTVCFDVIVKNLCDSTSCIMTTCFEVDPCGPGETNSLDDLALSPDAISFYPNPSRGKVKMNSVLAGKYQVKVYSAEGKLVFNKELGFMNAETKELELSHLTKGVYNIQCISENGFISKKIVIK